LNIFEYNSYHYSEIFKDFAQSIGGTTVDNILTLPPAVATGYIQCLALPNGLEALVVDATLTESFYLKRCQIRKEFYVLRYEEIAIQHGMTLRIDGDSLHTTNNWHAGIYLTSTLFDVSYLGRPGTSVKGINIIFNKEWLAEHLQLNDPEEVLVAYLALKTKSFNIEPIDNEYRRYFNEILQADISSPLYTATIQNRITLLIERFFSRLYEKSRHQLTNAKISKHDIHQLMLVESLLTQQVKTRPPTIDQMAAEAAMSAAKLKKLFKEVYGSSIYAYYQKQRMSHAREMLLSGDFTVKEVGLEIGYTNLSNFAAAFRKEFNLLPSEIRA